MTGAIWLKLSQPRQRIALNYLLSELVVIQFKAVASRVAKLKCWSVCHRKPLLLSEHHDISQSIDRASPTSVTSPRWRLQRGIRKARLFSWFGRSMRTKACWWLRRSIRKTRSVRFLCSISLIIIAAVNLTAHTLQTWKLWKSRQSWPTNP